MTFSPIFHVLKFPFVSRNGMHGPHAQAKILGRSFLFLVLTFQCRRCELPLQLSLALAHRDSRELSLNVLKNSHTLERRTSSSLSEQKGQQTDQRRQGKRPSR
jgi:hypothetical protein